MMLLGMRTYVVLLWGVSVLLSEVSVSDLVTVNSTVATTADPIEVTEQLISTREAHNEGVSAAATATAAAAADAAVPTTVETQRPIGANRSGDSTVGSFATNASATAAATAAAAAAATAAAATAAAAVTASSSSPGALPAVSTARAAAQPSTNMMITETGKPTENHLHRLSPTASTDRMSSSPVTSAAPPAEGTAVSLLQPSSSAEPEVPSNSSSNTSSAHSTQSTDFAQNRSSPSASYSASTIGGRTTPVVATMSTSSPASMRETSTNGTEPPASSEPLFETTASSSNFTPTAERNSSAETILSSTLPADANVSTTPVGVIPNRVPTKAIPKPTTKPKTDTTKSAKTSTTTEVQACSTRAVAVNCLIAIAILAGLATIFMVTTIVLCTMLSARKYKVKKPSEDTEMMCISSLLPEMNYSYTRQRNPVPNGVLVIHSGRDSDEDMGDNLTLSSFLPENDRFI